MATNEKQLEQKFSRFELKGVDLQKSEFTGFGSAIGNEDLGGDIIQPGAFTKTVQERVPKGYIKLLDNHNDSSTRNVWGTVTEAREVPWDGKGENAPSHKLFTRFKVSEADPDAQIALRKIAEKHIDQLSIGYRALNVEFEKDEDSDFDDPRTAWIMGQGRRLIKEIQLWEVSMVIWGMNPEATIIQNSINRLEEFARNAAKSNKTIPEDEVKSAILSLNKMIGKDANDSQRKAIAQALDGVSEAVDNVCSLAGKRKIDPLTALVDEYRKNHDVWNDETFSVWVTDNVKGAISDNEDDVTIEEKGCGCGKDEDDDENAEVEDSADTDAEEKEDASEDTEKKEFSLETDDDIKVDGEITLEPDQDELVLVLGKLADQLADFRSAVVDAEDSSSEEDTTPDADEVESEEEKDTHIEEDNEEAAKDTDADGRSKHFPGKDEAAAELERIKLMALEFDL